MQAQPEPEQLDSSAGNPCSPPSELLPGHGWLRRSTRERLDLQTLPGHLDLPALFVNCGSGGIEGPLSRSYASPEALSCAAQKQWCGLYHLWSPRVIWAVACPSSRYSSDFGGHSTEMAGL